MRSISCVYHSRRHVVRNWSIPPQFWRNVRHTFRCSETRCVCVVRRPRLRLCVCARNPAGGRCGWFGRFVLCGGCCCGGGGGGDGGTTDIHVERFFSSERGLLRCSSVYGIRVVYVHGCNFACIALSESALANISTASATNAVCVVGSVCCVFGMLIKCGAEQKRERERGLCI